MSEAMNTPAQEVRQEAQVMGRVHYNPDHAEPVRAVLNSIGRQLPDNAALYAEPQPGPDDLDPPDPLPAALALLKRANRYVSVHASIGGQKLGAEITEFIARAGRQAPNGE